jgi:hypothetical protein
MAPLIVMIAAWLVVRAFGALMPWSAADSWGGALRFALAAMFLFTAGSHFHPRTRGDLVRMVPPSLPAPAALVSFTGVLEVIGAECGNASGRGFARRHPSPRSAERDSARRHSMAHRCGTVDQGVGSRHQALEDDAIQEQSAASEIRGATGEG